MRQIKQRVTSHLLEVNWSLLLFLVFVLNVKMPVKVAAILLFAWVNRKMFFKKPFISQKYIWFYVVLMAIALINVLINISSISIPSLLSTATGIGFWILCIGAAMIVCWYVNINDVPSLHKTISLFFLLNLAVTMVQLFIIVVDAGSINPYRYQGMHQKYFIGTGDLLTGISFDVSTTNAFLNCFGLVYFLYRNKMTSVLSCMVGLLLTASNITNVLFSLVLIFIFIFRSSRNQKSIVVVCLSLLLIFMTKVSPQNNTYITNEYNTITDRKIAPSKPIAQPVTELPDSLLDPEQQRRKIATLYLDSIASVRISNPGNELKDFVVVKALIPARPVIPKPSIHSEPFQRKRDTSEFQKKLLDFALNKIKQFDTSFKETKSRKLPGKLIALKQTATFLKSHPIKMLAGDGMGRFSSKLAFRTTGLKMAGGYPLKYAYISNEFLENHLKLYFSYFSKDIELHSVINSPNAVYDQLIAEYGLLGMVAFIFLYLRFFWKAGGIKNYGLPLMLILLGAFWMDYWYEQLSIVIVFELLMLINLKENKQQNA